MIWRITIYIVLLVLTIEAKKYPQKWEEQEQWQEFEEFLKWKKMREQHEHRPHETKYEKRPHESYDANKIYESNEPLSNVNPPPIDKAALMARFIVNQAEWASVATISTRKDIESFPTVTLVSCADGLLGNGSGVPYLYLTPLDFTAQDLSKDNRATLLMTLAQGDYCNLKEWDPMDPRCARILLSGKIKPLKNDSIELVQAKKIYFNRHPKLINMPKDHQFYFAKLKIFSIVVLDTFGGPKYVTVKDYLHPPVDNVTEEFNQLFPMKYYENDSQQKYASVSNMLNPIVRTV
ncbi:cellular Repressor of E1A-stimulated Genes [Ptiloglossa arizonensis]|uniref:cellular Repressor of E1A-stimulated Genes n=1 Tax=Ptiloglossa arizonensis TaxID=3350558 RepID=UPI003F9F511E